MKNIHLIPAFLVSFVLCAFSCEKQEGTAPAGILIRFHNKTGADIQDITVDSVAVGSLPAGAQTGLIRFQTFGTDTGMPDSRFTGVQDGQLLESTSRFYWCGTEKSTLAEGRYVIEVGKVTVDGKPYFDLRFKR